MKLTLMGSGSGTNIDNLIETFKGDQAIVIDQVITDNPDAYLIERCKKHSVNVEIIPFTTTKKVHETEILNHITNNENRWVILAGYMRILSSHFIKQFYSEPLGHNRILNIHPSLLPLYPGLNSYERAFGDESVSQSGVTVHLVDEGVDTGPIVSQRAFPKIAGENLESFKTRGFEIEYQLYPEAIRTIHEKVKQHVYVPA